MVLGEREICIGPEILAAFKQTGTQISNTFFFQLHPAPFVTTFFFFLRTQISNTFELKFLSLLA